MLMMLSLASARATEFAVLPNLSAGIAAALLDPRAGPAGANLPGCRSLIDPHPVILVNATTLVMANDFGGLAPSLANAGYCVYTFNYGSASPTALVQAINPVAQSARELAAFISHVKKATGARKVDLVGHSQGGLLAAYYAKVLHGASNIRTIVALSPPTHGATAAGLVDLLASLPGANQAIAAFCAACVDQEPGSAVVTALNEGPVAQRAVSYTVIETTNENVVTPVGSSSIKERGVTNLWVQDFCPSDPVDHLGLSYDNVVVQLIKNALTPGLARRPDCRLQFPAPMR